MKKSFVLYTEYVKHIGLLTMEQRGILFTAIVNYEAGEQLPQMDGAVEMAFSFIKEQLDRDEKNYQNTVQKRSEAGKMGGRPKANASDDEGEESNEKQTKAKKANAFSEKQTKANESSEKQTKAKKPVDVDDDVDDKEKDRSIDRSKKKAEVSDDSGNTDQVEITDDHHLASFLQAHPTIRVDITSTAQLYGKDFSIVARAFRNSKWLQENCNSLSYICRKYEKIISGDYDGLGTPEHASGGEVGGLRPPRVEYKVL